MKIFTHGSEFERKKWAGFPKYVLMLGEYLVRKKFNRQIITIPNGVVILRPAESDGVLKKFGLKKGKYILTVGRFVPEKGFGDLIEAFAVWRGELGAGSSDSKLVITGRADHDDSYSKSLVDKATQTNNVVMTGFLMGEDLREIYSHAGLFVLPSYYEGLPIALLEAMSYGLSCIASDIPANREITLEDERYFKQGDISGLAIKIREFMNKPLSAAEKNSQIGLVAGRYDWTKIAEETLKVIKQF